MLFIIHVKQKDLKDFKNKIYNSSKPKTCETKIYKIYKMN